jgi:chromosome segregation ATPase
MRAFAGLLAALVLAPCLSGCALFGLWHRVDRDYLDDVPNEEKLLLFDAENGVYIAKDEIISARRAIEEAERAIDRAEDYGDVIDDRRESGATIDTPEVLNLLAQWNDARIALREIELELAEQRLDTAEVRLYAARARYEQAKAQLVKDHNPEEGTSIDIEDFDEQVADAEVDEKEALAALEEVEVRVTDQRKKYTDVSRKLQTVSKGAYGGPWADLID